MANSSAKKIDQLVLIDGSGSMSGAQLPYIQYAVKQAVTKAADAGKTIKVFLLSDRSAYETTNFDQLNLMSGSFTTYSLASLPAETRQADKIALITDGQVTSDAADYIARFSDKTQVIITPAEHELQDFKLMCDARGLRSIDVRHHDIIHSLNLALGKGLPKFVPDTRAPEIIMAERQMVRELDKVQQRISWGADRIQDNFTAKKKLQAEYKTLVRDFKAANAQRDTLEAALAALKTPAKAPVRKA